MNKSRVAFLTLGCKVNSYETDAMSKLFVDKGYEVVGFNEVADIYIVNTCSVTNMADRKSRQMLHKAKKNNPNGLIVATGCYVQASTEEVSKDEAIDLLVGNNKKKEIVEIVERYLLEIERIERERREFENTANEANKPNKANEELDTKGFDGKRIELTKEKISNSEIIDINDTTAKIEYCR